MAAGVAPLEPADETGLVGLSFAGCTFLPTVSALVSSATPAVAVVAAFTD